MHWYHEAFKKYADFSGRSRRKEYWYYVLFNLIITWTLAGLSMAWSMVGFVMLLYVLGSFIPGFAVTVRRLHDTGRSGWWMFISIIPLVGAIILIVWLAGDSQPGNNKYGPNAKAAPPSPILSTVPKPIG